MKTKNITYGECGWCAEVYEDDDNSSGYGGNAKIGYYYGTYGECEAIDINNVVMHSVCNDDFSSNDFFDLACERRFD